MKNTFLTIFTFITINCAFSTPDAGNKEHEYVIGYNQNYYYSMCRLFFMGICLLD